MSDEEKNSIEAAAKANGLDLDLLLKALNGLTGRQRRGWFCKTQMKARGLTFRAMAARRRVSAFLLSGAVSGRFTWSPRVIKALESELEIDLSPFFEKGESREPKKKLDKPGKDL